VTSEVALALVLLVGAGLLIRTFAAIRATHLGYETRNVFTGFLALPLSPDGSRTEGLALFGRIRERLRAIQGIRLAATASSLPMAGVSISMDVQPYGQPVRRREHVASMDVVSDDYFRVMEIPIRKGRAFARTDRDGSTPVVIVSESVASRYFDGKAIGRRIVVSELRFLDRSL